MRVLILYASLHLVTFIEFCTLAIFVVSYMLNRNTGNVTVFFLVKIGLSICPNTYEFFQIFFNFRKARLLKNV